MGIDKDTFLHDGVHKITAGTRREGKRVASTIIAMVLPPISRLAPLHADGSSSAFNQSAPAGAPSIFGNCEAMMIKPTPLK